MLVLFGIAFGIFVAVSFFFQRWRYRRRERQGKRRFGFYPNAGSLGNALQALQAIAQPQIQHVLEEKLDELSDEDESGGPNDPIAHLCGQAAKIRKGEPPGMLTARLPPRP